LERGHGRTREGGKRKGRERKGKERVSFNPPPRKTFGGLGLICIIITLEISKPP